MKVAVIGGGGREHTLAWKLAQSPSVDKLYAIPGSAAMSEVAQCVDIALSDLDAITDYAKNEGIDMLVVGPEVPLTEGIADLAQSKGLAVFGPNKAAAQMEGSKVFAKNLMKKYHVPTAAYASFTDGEAAKAYIKEQGAPIVVKADGLAAGKGVVVAQTEAEAIEAVNAMMEDHIFGASGGRIVIEECMVGEEASLLAFVDGKTIVPMISAQDHKRIFDNDEGPNTGGMGAYAPAPVVTPEIRKEVEEKILKPVVDGLKQEGITYQGCLYAGLMITADGPKVVEFNCRFGDPETQVVLPLLKTDLLTIMRAVHDETLSFLNVEFKDESAACVVIASGGYPLSYGKGYEIDFGDSENTENVTVFHAGTAEKDGKIVTSGGRVLGVTATGKDLNAALSTAYKATEQIKFKDAFYRKDIGARALAALKK